MARAALTRLLCVAAEAATHKDSHESFADCPSPIKKQIPRCTALRDDNLRLWADSAQPRRSCYTNLTATRTDSRPAILTL